MSTSICTHETCRRYLMTGEGTSAKLFFFSSRRRHTSFSRDWSSDVCSSDLRGGTVVTCDDHDRVVSGDVLIGPDGRIAAIGRAVAPDGAAARLLDARGCAVIPGLVQAHVHLCQVAMRGMADDLPLLAWLRERIWPLEAAHDERTAAASAELGLVEAMLGGTTTVL